ncbi:MAG: hypothetical protein HY908_17150 [Myxococcales bacterium]|nr:hypothetical protein [Myxococcales bacterium]
MKREYIRSYRILDPGDIEVVDARNGERVDLSAHYAEVPRDRGTLRRDASLEVFRFADGQLVWSASPNGQSTDSAAALSLLLSLYLEDLAAPVGAPRAL